MDQLTAKAIVCATWMSIAAWLYWGRAGLSRAMLIGVAMLVVGCGGGALSSPSGDVCFWQESDSAHADILHCAPGTPIGCICGARLDDGNAEGSCFHGSCCTGCVDIENVDGAEPKCWPGDGTGNRWGKHGATCLGRPD